MFSACQHSLLIVQLSAIFLADRTATQYDRLLACHPSGCLSVRPSVTLCIVALKADVQG